MDLSLQNKIVLLTGASEGIGRALALRLAREHSRLALVARGAERLEGLAAECRALGAQTLVLAADITDEAVCRSLVERVIEQFGGIDILINNAGRTMWARLDELSDTAVLESVLRLNYLAAAWLSFYALPALKRSRGRLVAIASVAGLTGVPCRSAYAASKHAMVGFFESLRIELRDSGVSVTIIAPDFVLTETHRRALGPDGKPLGRSPMQEAHIMNADRCACMVIRAMRRRRRLLITSWRGRVGRWLKLIAPALIDSIAERAIQRKR